MPKKTKPQHIPDFSITLIATPSGSDVILESVYNNPNNYPIRNHSVVRRITGDITLDSWSIINVGELWVANGPCGGPLAGYTWKDLTRELGVVYDYYATVTYVIVPCDQYYQNEQHQSAVSETITI